MISEQLATKTLKAVSSREFILNQKWKWRFLDEYAFSDPKKDPNCPSYVSTAIGLAGSNDGKHYSAEWCISKHTDLKAWSSALYLIGDDNKIFTMIDVLSIEET